jgi:glutathione peroxidase
MGLGAAILGFVNRIRHRKIPKPQGDIYQFQLKTLAGKEMKFESLRGKKLLIVNTASKCTYTRQYADLQKLHEKYNAKVVVLGFPANDFLWQEPGSGEQIQEFCQVNYGVTFPMSEKISVAGNRMHPLFEWLAGKTGKIPSWNFCKYLVSEDGTNIKFFPPNVDPLDSRIINLINQ